MGSVFVVTVPIRDQEVLLRKQELKITGIQAVETTAINKDDFVQRISSMKSIESSNDDTTISSPRGSYSGSEYDIYTGIADGKTARVIVGSDEMTIVQLDDENASVHKEPEKHKKRSSSAGDEEDSAIKTMIDNIYLEKHLEDCLQKFDIMSACWGQSIDGNFSQVEFTVCSEKSEKILNHMQTVGIGYKYNSSLCICSASFYHENDMRNLKKATGDGHGIHKTASGDLAESSKQIRSTKWNEFVASIKSRLTVAQVVQGVKANAIMTFDYIILIIVAGMIAGLGLVDDSSVNVVASMLVSPLMGPIMATTFGAVIRDFGLIKIGLLSELVGLLICLAVGLIFGIFLEIHRGPWAEVTKWPTDQMRGRSEMKSLMVGVLVAIPSGAGVALSILAGNSGSLVGVAISASLLPPAVNCGILWGLAMTIAVKEAIEGRDPLVDCHTSLGNHNYFVGYKPIYCENAAKEFSIMGIVSFGLTWLNIILIFLVGVIILKIKEVAPHTTRKNFSRFWKEDLKIAREFNQQGGTMKGIIEELDETGDKDAILKRLQNDQVFHAVNRRNVLAPTSNIIEDLQRKSAAGSTSEENVPLKPSKSTKTTAPGQNTSSGGWLWGMFGGSKVQQPPPVTQEETEQTEAQKSRPRPKLQ